VVNRGALSECVINVSEGRDPAIIAAVRAAGGESVLDVHSDPEHHRSVLTLGGPLEVVEESARQVVAVAVSLIDLRSHVGIHPRLGAVDVVPFVALPDPFHPTQALRPDVLDARGDLAEWAGAELGLPCFLYGPERTLPDVRRLAFRSLRPDTGPRTPHLTAGATAVGARPVLVAYNLWIAGPADRDPGDRGDQALRVARSLAADLRGPSVRALGLPIEAGAQVSINLIDPGSVPFPSLYDAVAGGARSAGCSVLRAELVGLVPARVLDQVPRHRWAQLDLSPDGTIESRMQARGYPLARVE
jgi:glutamate formiminotransferase / 5-formyltetrahydrofolate cyclo-ligase